MKAAIFSEVGKPFSIEDVPMPEVGPDELLLKVEACGVCASDTHASSVPGYVGAGTVMGHEFVGRVAAIGADVTGWTMGQRATALPYASCGKCARCLAGDEQACGRLQYLGFSPDNPGAFAEYVRVKARSCVMVAEGIAHRSAAMIEPLAVGYDTARRARIKVGDSVLIVGAGPIGLTVALWARHAGAAHVVVSDLVESRLCVARQVGASATIDAGKTPDTRAAFANATGCPAPDVIVEAVGAPGMIQRCIDMAGFGTRIAIVGVCMQDDTIKPAIAIRKAVELIFCMGYSRDDWQRIIALLETGEIDPAPIVTAEVAFADFPAQFEALKTPGDALKVLLAP